MTSSKTVTQYT